MSDFPQKLWSPKTALDSFKVKAPERALLVVRGHTAYPELDERVAFWKQAMLDCLRLSSSAVQLTTFPATFNFLSGAHFLREAPSLLLMEAPSTVMAHSPGSLFNEIHNNLRSEGCTVEEWARIFPLLLSTQGESYVYQEGIAGRRLIRDGEERLEATATFNNVARLSVKTSDYQEKVRTALTAIKDGNLPEWLNLPAYND